MHDMEECNTDIEEEVQKLQELERIDRVQVFGSRINRLANEAVTKRSVLETRWLSDLRQHEGQYNAITEQSLADDPTKSAVFGNITRRSVNAAEARIIDMLFPTDDKNWGLTNTPVPEMSQQRKEAELSNDIGQAAEIDSILEQAEKAAEGMEREIDDQLGEADYNGKARNLIHDMCLYGTGIIKAPVVIGRTKKIWKQVTDSMGNEVSVLDLQDSHAPTVQHVSIWNYFPDPNALTQEDCEYELERHYMTRRSLAKLLKAPGFFHNEIKQLLTSEPNRTINDNGRLAQMRAISGLESANYLENRYEVWEYTGAVIRSELEDLGVELDDDTTPEFDCVVFVCNNRVIKATLNPLETSDHPYCAVPYEKDESSIFGKGIPFLMRDSQGILSAGWRTLMENMGISSGDQIVVDKKIIRPADGKWKVTPRKIWYKNDPNAPMNAAFATFAIPSRQVELMNIIDAAMKMADEETNMPRLMYGESAGASAQTMGGMAMQMNSANVVLRRAIKNYDDNITRPMIRRFYDFNMQFNPKDEIKGDFSVKARGSSALLVKEQQAQSLMQLMSISGQPGYAEITKRKDLYRKVVQAMHLDADDIIMSDDEIAAMEQSGSENPPQDPAVMKAQMDGQLAQMKFENERVMLQMKLESEQSREAVRMQDNQQERQERMMEMQLEREITIAKLSAEHNLSIEKIDADLTKAREKHAADWKLFISEVEVKSQLGSGI